MAALPTQLVQKISTQEAVALFTYEDGEDAQLRALDKRVGGALTALRSEGFEGKPGQTELVRGPGQPRWIVVAGLGPRATVTLETLRRAAGVAAKTARKKAASLLLVPPRLRLPKHAVASALVEGAQLANYRFLRYKTNTKELRVLKKLSVLAEKTAEMQRALDETLAVVDGVLTARDLVNTPSSDMTPAQLEREARRLAKQHGLSLTVFDEKELRKRKMGAILAVGKGSAVPPRIIILRYNGRRRAPHVVCCGKGVCYDSGGYNLKLKMLESMKDDMGGAAALLGLVQVVATLKLPVRLTIVLGAVENMVDGKAYRPGDVVQASNGTTIEVVNTDAEGRLVLADCLSYASTLAPDLLLDIATLTGAAMVALGPLAAAVCTPNDRLASALLRAGEASGDRAWRIPLWDDYKEDIKSDIADVKNLGHSFYAGITAGAIFLQEFVTQPEQWLHIDIGAAVMEDRERAYIPKGATGWGVRILTKFLREYQR